MRNWAIFTQGRQNGKGYLYTKEPMLICPFCEKEELLLFKGLKRESVSAISISEVAALELGME
jgi:hypothetical protein